MDRAVQVGTLTCASGDGHRTPLVEGAPGGGPQRAGGLAAEGRLLGAPLVQTRNRGDQRTSVRMARSVQHLSGRALFDDPTAVHHGDPVGHMADRPQVMGDVDQGQAGSFPDVAEDAKDARLHRYVERCHRFVGDQQLRFDRERTGDAHPLALAAGQLS